MRPHRGKEASLSVNIKVQRLRVAKQIHRLAVGMGQVNFPGHICPSITVELKSTLTSYDRSDN